MDESFAIVAGAVSVGLGGVEVGAEKVGVDLGPQPANETARATRQHSQQRGVHLLLSPLKFIGISNPDSGGFSC